MKIHITLKESFGKGYIFKKEEIEGNLIVEGKTKKELLIYFIPERKIIEVTHRHGYLERNSLEYEERIAIIEEILNEYATLKNSIKHLSTNYYLEQYVLIDTTNVDTVSQDYDKKGLKPIIHEYLSSNYAKTSKYTVFRELKKINDILSCISSHIGKEKIVFTLNSKLSKFQKNDIKYFMYYILEKYTKLYDLKVNIDSKGKILELYV